MCGRFTLAVPADILMDLFEIQAQDVPSLAPRYNIAPTQGVAAVRCAEGVRRLDILHWGLIPSWSQDPSIGARMINARAETVAEKPAFRSAFRRRRCLIPADGFYEWRKLPERRQPYLFRLPDGSLMGLAGLWEHWESPDGSAVESCTILTTEANEVVRPIHARMPVILRPESFEAWLDPEVQSRDVLEPLLRQGGDLPLQHYAVSTYVNSPRHDDPRCVEPVEL
jgi:putative SOS response-associated peptidase YedK